MVAVVPGQQRNKQNDQDAEERNQNTVVSRLLRQESASDYEWAQHRSHAVILTFDTRGGSWFACFKPEMVTFP